MVRPSERLALALCFVLDATDSLPRVHRLVRFASLPLGVLTALVWIVESCVLDVTFDLVFWLLLATLAALMFAGCVSAPRMNEIAAHAHTVLEDPNASDFSKQNLLADIDDAASVSNAQMHSAESGDFRSLLLQLVSGGVLAVATGAATYWKTNRDRDRSSTERTSADLRKLRVPQESSST